MCPYASPSLQANHDISHITWCVHAVGVAICIARPSNVEAKATSADAAGSEARQAMERWIVPDALVRGHLSKC
jgi:hypothetical protein